MSDIKVMLSAAFKEAYLELLPQFERASGHKQITVFSAGLHARAQSPDAARALVEFLTSPAAAPVIRRKGMEPT
jgi:ABC-type molybdate transport system substrate-binding protein